MAAVTLPSTFTLPQQIPGLLRPLARPVGGSPSPRLLVPPSTARIPASSATYRRRQAVALVVLLLAAACLSLGVGVAWSAVTADAPASARATSSPTPAAVVSSGAEARVHVVQPGETIWSIASDLRPHDDVRPLVDDLIERNGGSSALVAGQRLDLTGL